MSMKNLLKRFRVILGVLFIAGSILFINSCKEEEPTLPPGTGSNSLEVVFTGTANGETFNLTDSFENNVENFKYTFEIFKFYVSQFRLVRNDNSELLVKDIEMIDFRTDKPNLSFKASIPEGSFKEIKFGIGVDSVTNAKDPTIFPAESPLSITKGTHWGMAAQYRFLLMEGKIDTTGTDTTYKGFVVHTGTNPLYREVTISKSLQFTKGDNKVLTLNIDFDNFLSNINFKQKNVSHTIGGGFDIAENVTNSFTNSITLK